MLLLLSVVCLFYLFDFDFFIPTKLLHTTVLCTGFFSFTQHATGALNPQIPQDRIECAPLFLNLTERYRFFTFHIITVQCTVHYLLNEVQKQTKQKSKTRRVTTTLYIHHHF